MGISRGVSLEGYPYQRHITHSSSTLIHLEYWFLEHSFILITWTLIHLEYWFISRILIHLEHDPSQHGYPYHPSLCACDTIKSVTWLIHMWLDSFICTLDSFICTITPSTTYDSFILNMTFQLWRLLLVCATWLIPMWCDSLIYHVTVSFDSLVTCMIHWWHAWLIEAHDW